MSAYFRPLFGYSGDDALAVSARAFIFKRRDLCGTAELEEQRLTLHIGPGTRAGNLPLVSCLMPTRNRCRQAMFAIDCFRRQTWPNRELIILDQSRDEALADHVRGLSDDRIRFHALPSATLSLGALRNRTLDLARGSFVCTWDDDDLQHPARIELAMAAIVATQSVACLLGRVVMWFPATGKSAVLPLSPLEGTLLAPRAILPRYADLNRGEDTPAVTALMDRHRVVLLDLPELYVYVAHGLNTSDRRHLRTRWRSSPDWQTFSRERSLFARSYPLDQYAAAIARAEPAADDQAEAS